MAPLDWSRIRSLPLAERVNKVSIKDFCPWPSPEGGDPLELLPEILVGRQWREFIEIYLRALRQRKKVMMMMGGHVVKTGLSPLIISLLERGAIHHIAMNGAAAIHDFEIAMIGETSEDVAQYLEDGRFGLWTETGEGMNSIINEAAARAGGPGFGAALGEAIEKKRFRHRKFSILAAAHRLGIPLTVHPAIGAEIIHEHPSCSGASIGELGYRDFKIIAESIAGIHGGVVMNWGSAVILPEVFLKALTVVRNLGGDAYEFTSANFDMLRQYRPLVNVVDRPTRGAGAANAPGAKSAKTAQPARGFLFTGHHEIMFPLFYHSIAQALDKRKKSARRAKG